MSVTLETLINDPDLQPIDEPNLARGGESRVARAEAVLPDGEEALVYIKKQHDYCFRDPHAGFRKRPTLLREYRGLKRLEQLGITAPDVVLYRQRGKDAILVTRALSGYVDLDTALSGANPTKRVRIVAAVSQVLRRLHTRAWRHGCLYPKHVLIRNSGVEMSVALIDLEKMRRVLSAKRAAVRDLDQLFGRSSALTKPEVDLMTEPYEAQWPGIRAKLQRRLSRRTAMG